MTTENDGSHIYRYKFSDPVTELLTAFAKLHANDDRRTYKEAWTDWWNLNTDVLDPEIRRLQMSGYEGSIEDKMYKAGRYYFRTKNAKRPKPQARRAYISMTAETIEAMDTHLDSIMTRDDFTPAKGYNWFCAEFPGLLRAEIVHLRNAGILDNDDLISKVRKTYKNRYYLRRD